MLAGVRRGVRAGGGCRVKPADLKPGDRLDTAIGALIVHDKPWGDLVPDDSQWDRIFVDVRVENAGKFGDPDRLSEVTGATDFQWLGSTPTLRYRLAFRPDTDVEATR
jgi:hypothetical protein